MKAMERPRQVYVWMAIMGWMLSASPILLFPFLGVGHVSSSVSSGFEPAWFLVGLGLFVASDAPIPLTVGAALLLGILPGVWIARGLDVA